MSKWAMAILLASISTSACFADDSAPPGSTAGFAGTGGSGGVGGTGGSATGGTGGTGGSGGSSGTGGSGGSGGSSVDAGTGGGGSGGVSGSGGTGGASGTGGSGGASGSGGAGTGGASGTGGTGGIDAATEPVPCVQGTGPTSLPFAVDEFFTASGWMGDIAAIHMEATCGPSSDAGDAGSSDARPPEAGPADVSMSDGSARDGGMRIPTAKCWTVTYTSTPSEAGVMGWAGVDWQFPANNWGTLNGRVIPRGATRVRVTAWGAAGGEVVSFNVGYGFVSPDLFGVTLANQILTTTPTTYDLDLTGIDYTCPSVRMGFGWTVAGTTPVKFYIDHIEWR